LTGAGEKCEGRVFIKWVYIYMASRFVLDCKINRNYSPAIKGNGFLLITSYVS